MRILYVTPRFRPYVGGTETHTYEVGRRLAAAGHEVSILTTDLEGRLPAEESMDGMRVRRVPAWPTKMDIYFAPGIYRTIKDGRWDVVHCQGYHTLVAPLAMLAARQRRLPYWVTFHSGGHSSPLRRLARPIQRALLRPLLAGSQGLIGVSRWEADFFQKRLGLPARRFHVIPNGATLPEPGQPAAVKSHGDPLLVSIGRLERYKGHQQVIRALPWVLEAYPQARLRIAGSGPYEQSLRRLAERLGVAGQVEIRAIPAGRQDLMSAMLMESALVILLSSYESQSIAASEAIALGRPLLVADSTALHDLAGRGLARAVRLDCSPREIAEAIVQQLVQPLVPVTGSLPTWDSCAAQLLALYQSSLGGAR